MSDAYKKQAAEAAITLIESDMLVGLGHGSTVQFALEALAVKIASGELKGIVGIPASKHTELEATRLGIPLADFGNQPHIDLTFDGADEVDPHLNLIKGGGGALLREKMLAQNSRREVIMVDESKLSRKLGTNQALPLEVIPFGWQIHLDFIASLGGEAKLRLGKDGQPALSDQRNYLLDCKFRPISDVAALARQLETRSGIVEHGLFVGLATDVFVAGTRGLQHLKSAP